MTGSKKVTRKTGEQMRETRAHGESRSDWARVRHEANSDPDARDMSRKVGALIARKCGQPVEGEPKQAVSLRVPESVLMRWKATGPGWQTRMVERLSAP